MRRAMTGPTQRRGALRLPWCGCLGAAASALTIVLVESHPCHTRARVTAKKSKRKKKKQAAALQPLADASNAAAVTMPAPAAPSIVEPTPLPAPALHEPELDALASLASSLRLAPSQEAEGNAADVDEALLCVVCMHEQKTHLFVPCGHQCVRYQRSTR